MRVEMPLKKQMKKKKRKKKKKKNLHVDAYIKAVSYRTSSNENRRTGHLVFSKAQNTLKS